MDDARKNAIIAEIKKCATAGCLTDANFLSKSSLSPHVTKSQLYGSGMTWSRWCELAGVRSGATSKVTKEDLFVRLKNFFTALQRLPKSKEAEEAQLFKKSISKSGHDGGFGSMHNFYVEAAKAGYIPESAVPQVKKQTILHPPTQPPIRSTSFSGEGKQIPPPPERSVALKVKGKMRDRWQRSGVYGLPYEPTNEIETIALFAILCVTNEVNWEIVQLNPYEGIDAVCFDHGRNKHLRVEFKWKLDKQFDKKPDDYDHIVCWKSSWKDCPKPVTTLEEILHSLNAQRA